jgi:hypothetical protein
MERESMKNDLVVVFIGGHLVKVLQQCGHKKSAPSTSINEWYQKHFGQVGDF